MIKLVDCSKSYTFLIVHSGITITVSKFDNILERESAWACFSDVGIFEGSAIKLEAVAVPTAIVVTNP